MQSLEEEGNRHQSYDLTVQEVLLTRPYRLIPAQHKLVIVRTSCPSMHV